MQGPGNLNSGAGVVDVSVIPANRAVSPIRVACQCPRKVSQVHNRVTPRSDTRAFFSTRFSSHLTVGVQNVYFRWVRVSALCPLRTWFPVCLFVCLFLWVRGSDCAFQTVSAEPYWMGSDRLMCLYTKSPFVLKKNNWAFHRDSHNLAVALKDIHTHKHRDPSQSLSQYLSPLSNTQVGYETMLLVPLLLTLSVLWS